MPNVLKMDCKKCRISSSCHRFGSSPLRMPNKPAEYCQIVGGYGREPVDPMILSPESLKARDKGGPCLTIAYVPVYDEETKQVDMELTKIFAMPVLHERETISWNAEMMYPKSHT